MLSTYNKNTDIMIHSSVLCMACNHHPQSKTLLLSSSSSLPGVIIAVSLLFVSVFIPLSQFTLAQHKIPSVVASIGTGEPTIKDPNLKVETVATGLSLPTTMGFIGANDILVLEKSKGIVQRIVNGQMLAEPLLQVHVSS